MPFVYLAGPSGPSQQETFDLAVQHGVIAKPFFRVGDNWASDNRLGALTENSTLYLAYRNQNGGLGAVQTFNLHNAEGNNATTPLAANDVVQDQYNGDPPNVVGTVNEESDLQDAILAMGYPTDPKVNLSTVICVVGVEDNQANDAVLDALNAWYAGLDDKQTTVHEIALEVLGQE